MKGLKEYLDESLVYRFYISFYTFNKNSLESKHHTHSGMIIARNTKDVYDKLYNSFKEVYEDETDNDDLDKFDFDEIKIVEHTDFYSDDMIIYDEGDDYFGV